MTKMTTLFVLSALLLTPCVVDAQSIGLKLGGAIPNADGSYQLAAGDDIRFLTELPGELTQVVLLASLTGPSGAMTWDQSIVLVQADPANVPVSMLDIVVPVGLEGLSLSFLVLAESIDGEILSSPVLMTTFIG